MTGNALNHSSAKVKKLLKEIKSVLKQGIELPVTIELTEKQWLCSADHHWLLALLKDEGIKASSNLDNGWNFKEITILEVKSV